MGFNEGTLDLLSKAFRPHAPINNPEAFVGREVELSRIKESLFQPGLQIVIFGERGAGKTSLANVATSMTSRVQVFCEESSTFVKIVKDIILEYQKLDPERIVYDAKTGIVQLDGAILPIDNLDGNSLRRVLPQDKALCVVLDELDRISDDNVMLSIAELAKNISTYQPNVKLVLIGVAGNLKSLLRGHESNFRNVREFSLGPMTKGNVAEIIRKGANILGVTFSDEVIEQITELSDRYPYYVHLISTEAARACLLEGATRVGLPHLDTGVIRAAEDAHSSLRETYDRAVMSVKISSIYRYAIWGLANLPGSSHTTSEIHERVNKFAVAEGGARVSVQAVGQALKKLGGEGKMSIVHSPVNGFHGLAHPLMKGYVRLVMRREP